jgi:prolyl-tRNA editing enzyme YbaK/EbsC (Cys-tRNA(Pro) deacylase)
MPLPASAQRVLNTATSLGLAVEIVDMPHSTRTAGEAAKACGCAVGQIVKSLVFCGKSSGQPYLLLVSGANRVDQSKIAATLGEVLDRPDAQFVREVTGFAIGGIPPFGHDTPLKTWIDRDLMTFAHVWAAAGTPNCVMKLDPQALKSATGAGEFVPA